MSTYIQLPNGKTTLIDTWKSLTILEDGYEDLVADDNGFSLDNPFNDSGSEIFHNLLQEIPDISEIDIEDVPKEILRDK
jgi:hypothetical protein